MTEFFLYYLYTSLVSGSFARSKTKAGVLCKFITCENFYFSLTVMSDIWGVGIRHSESFMNCACCMLDKRE